MTTNRSQKPHPRIAEKEIIKDIMNQDDEDIVNPIDLKEEDFQSAMYTRTGIQSEWHKDVNRPAAGQRRGDYKNPVHHPQ